MNERTMTNIRVGIAGCVALLAVGCPAQPVTVCAYTSGGNCFDVNRSFNFDDARVAAIDPSSLPAASNVCREPVRVEILRVIDGDTFDVGFADGTTERVRLIGANTPETHPPDMGLPHCLGGESFAFSNSMIGHSAILTFDQDCTDDFDRALAYAWFGTNRSDLWQTQLLRRGLARQLTVSPNDNFAPLFLEDENAAREAELGIWGECRGTVSPTNP